MRTPSVNLPPLVLTLLTLLTLQAWTAGCGASSSPMQTDAAVTAPDTAQNSDDAPPDNTGCNFPSCMTALGASCIPDGDCVSQVGTTSLNVCYANGLRYAEIVALGGAGSTAAITASNGPTACFTGSATASSLIGNAVTFTLKNPAGTEIATMTQDIATGATSITCKGGSPVVLNAACSGGGACTIGTCP
jgi:hypothetical protein